MGISLNNHELRIKALENKGSGNWRSGETSTGIWWKEESSGLIIQHSKGNMTNWGTINLPLAYSTANSYSIVGTFGNWNSRWEPTDSTTVVSAVSKSQILVWSRERLHMNWLTIGY